MALIKHVTNGNSSVAFKAVSLGHAVAIAFGLVSIIGAQQTWLWAGAHERDMIVASVRAQIVSDIERHSMAEERQFAAIERDHLELTGRMDAMSEREANLEKQVNINTGIIEHRHPK